VGGRDSAQTPLGKLTAPSSSIKGLLLKGSEGRGGKLHGKGREGKGGRRGEGSGGEVVPPLFRKKVAPLSGPRVITRNARFRHKNVEKVRQFIAIGIKFAASAISQFLISNSYTT